MQSEFADLAIRPMTHADLALFARWVRQPHWQKWWDDPQMEIDQVKAMLEGRDSTRPHIFSVGGVPAGYIQYWFADDFRGPEWQAEAPWIEELPRGTVGVDLSIGDPAQIGRGIGPAALRNFIAMLREQGHDTIIIDPDRQNQAAIRAYEKAGFRAICSRKARDIVLMQHHCETYE